MGHVHLTSGRIVVLVAGALLCLAVAAWPLVASRGGRRPGSYSWRLSAFALITAVGFVATILTPRPAKPPLRPLVELPAASALGPGTAIAVSYADGTGGMACTAGFLVRTRKGKTGVLTAGHCNKTGEGSPVSMNPGSGAYLTVGTFSMGVSEGMQGEEHDIGLVMLDSDKIPRTPSITPTSMPVAGVAGDLEVGQQLCKYGMKTGRVECGQITDVTESKVVFLAGSQCGDSGGPVYLIRPDGAAAVGIHIRAGRPNDPNPNCSTPATFSVAERIQPWLDQWGLSLVTG